MLNITAVGRLGKDPELRTTQSGQEITSFSLGVNVFAKGEQQTVWLKCSIWGKRGDVFRNYCQQGPAESPSAESCLKTPGLGKDGEVKDLCVDVQDFSLPPREQPQQPARRRNQAIGA